MSLISLYNIVQSLGGKEPVIDEADLDINEGDFIFLTGVSGAGKTTVLKIIYGLLKPTSGEIFYHFHPSPKIRNLSRFRSKIGFIFQNSMLLENRSVEYNVSLPLKILGVNRQAIEKEVSTTLEVCFIDHLKKSSVSLLSGGEKQLVSLARCIITSPLLILADEPTANLDYNMAVKLMDILLKLNENGSTVVISTHDIQLMETYESRILLIKNKKIIDYNNSNV